jgi:Ca-activated chloride channel family protein
MPRRLPFVLVALAGALSYAAQSQPPTFRVDVDVVYVTATVRDQKGGLVSDLTEDDFQIFEDGRPQKLTLFAPASQPEDKDAHNEALGLNLGMLLDTSESMKDQIKLTQETAIHFLEAIPRARDLLLIFFDQDIRLSRYTSENQQGLFERILEAKGRGNTALYDAISVYLSRVSDSSGRKVLIVYTDGEDTTSAIGLADVLHLVRSSGVVIYPIAFSGASFGIGTNRYLSAHSFLSQLAEASGGQIYSPKAMKDVASIYLKVLDELQNQYVLGFVSDRPEKDKKFRKLLVKLKRSDLRIRHRTGYYAVPFR